MINIKNVTMRFNLGIDKTFSLKKLFIKILSFKKTEKNLFFALKDVSFSVENGKKFV